MMRPQPSLLPATRRSMRPANRWAGVSDPPSSTIRERAETFPESLAIIRNQGRWPDLHRYDTERRRKRVDPKICCRCRMEASQISLSDFGSDGRDVSHISIAGLGPETFHLELADAHLGAHRWLGIQLLRIPHEAESRFDRRAFSRRKSGSKSWRLDYVFQPPAGGRRAGLVTADRQHPNRRPGFRLKLCAMANP